MLLLQDSVPFNTQSDNPNRFGIEIEVENFKVNEEELPNTFWEVTSDSSLKVKGVEFVSRILDRNQVETALNSLFEMSPFVEKTATFGPRTSIHIHSNALWMSSMQQVVPLLFIYLLSEDLMYSFIEPHRRKNIFCVKTKETDYLRNCFANESLQPNNTYKYAGFNLASLFAHGTVEFRMLEGTYDIEKILTWISFIESFQRYAQNMPVGLDFKREVKIPVIASEIIQKTFSPFFSNTQIEQSIASGIEYFRYLVAPGLSSKIAANFVDDSEAFYKSSFYTKNYVRPSK